MKKVGRLLIILVLAGASVISLGNRLTASAENQGTDGTEIQVMEPEQLEIQLGKEWAGRGFQLKTDAGLYPGIITVGEDGVLRTELGGSTHYILTCMLTGSSDASGQVPTTEEFLSDNPVDASIPNGQTESEYGENATEETVILTPQIASAEAGTGTAVNGESAVKTSTAIPAKHLILFFVGMVIAIGTLIVIHVAQKRREEQEDYDEEDYEDE